MVPDCGRIYTHSYRYGIRGAARLNVRRGGLAWERSLVRGGACMAVLSHKPVQHAWGSRESPVAHRGALLRGFVQFQRQAVGVGEEGEAATGVFVHPHRFAGHALGVQVGDGRVQRSDAEGQVAQAAGFRA